MRRIFLVIGLILILILGAALIFLKVKNISCKTDSNSACPSNISDSLKSFEGRRLFGSQKLLQEKLQREPQVKKFSLQVSPLGDISVNLILREADIALKPESSDKFTLYTSDGIVVKDDSSTSLPSILLKEQVDSSYLPFIVTLGWQLNGILPVNDMSVQGNSLVIHTRDDKTLYYPLSGDIDLLLGTTLATFSQLNLSDGKLIIEGKATNIREIDFRFKNPVLR